MYSVPAYAFPLAEVTLKVWEQRIMVTYLKYRRQQLFIAIYLLLISVPVN